MRLVWGGGEHALHYAVEIEKLENNTYRSHLREYTTDLFFRVSLLPGEYRYRIIPYDILGRPAPGSPWISFQVRPVQIIEADTMTETVIGNEQNQPVGTGEEQEDDDQIINNDEQDTENTERNSRFNTLGISVGSAFADPLVILSLHGSFAPFRQRGLRNIFFELGCDFGFISMYDDVKGYYSIYPFAHIGYFVPFKEKGGWFFSVGGGYMVINYSFPYGDDLSTVIGFNFTTGVNLWDFLNISYTLRTDFGSANHKAAVGYVYRFREQRAMSKEQ